MKTQIFLISFILFSLLFGKLTFAELKPLESIVPEVLISSPAFELAEEADETLLEDWMKNDEFWQVDYQDNKVLKNEERIRFVESASMNWIEEVEESDIESWMIDDNFWE